MYTIAKISNGYVVMDNSVAKDHNERKTIYCKDVKDVLKTLEQELTRTQSG